MFVSGLLVAKVSSSLLGSMNILSSMTAKEQEVIMSYMGTAALARAKPAALMAAARHDPSFSMM